MNKLKIKTPITNASEGYLLNLPNKSDGEQYTVAVDEDVVHRGSAAGPVNNEDIYGNKTFKHYLVAKNNTYFQGYPIYIEDASNSSNSTSISQDAQTGTLKFFLPQYSPETTVCEIHLPRKSGTLAIDGDVVHNTGNEDIDGKKDFWKAAEFDAGIAFGAAIDHAGAYIKNHTNNSYYDLEIGTGYKSSQIILRDADAQYGIDGTGIRFKTSGWDFTDPEVSHLVFGYAQLPINDGSTANNYYTIATEEYVDIYGGKIDSISLNSTPLTIDANKNVDIPISLETYASGDSASNKNRIEVGTDRINVATTDTVQTITGSKTFAANTLKLTGDHGTITTVSGGTSGEEIAGLTSSGNVIAQGKLISRVSSNYAEYNQRNIVVGQAGGMGYTYTLTLPTKDGTIALDEDVIHKGTSQSSPAAPETRYGSLTIDGNLSVGNGSGTTRSFSLFSGGGSHTLKPDVNNNLRTLRYSRTGSTAGNIDIDFPNASGTLALKSDVEALETNINAKVLSYQDTMDILTSIVMPQGTTVENNNVTFPEGVTVSNHNINL